MGAIADPSRLARRGDPSSSRRAARALVDSGAHRSQTEEIYQLLLAAERATGRAVTASEVEHESARAAEGSSRRAYPAYLILKRLNDLRADERVDNGADMLCPVTGRHKTTWRAVRQTKLALVASVSGGKRGPSRAELLDGLQAAAEALGPGDAGQAARTLLTRAGR